MAYKIKGYDDGLASDSKNVVKSVNLSKRTLEIVGSDESEDRQGDIVLISSWNFENYKKNPVMLWSHDYTGVPLPAEKKTIKTINQNLYS